MKTSILFLLLVVMSVPVALGQIKIGDNPQNIDAASVLELESSSRVLVITRVSTAEMEAIVPQRGGLVYNTDTECIHYHDGSQWINLCGNIDGITFSAENIVNNPDFLSSSIVITQDGNNYNFEVNPGSIRSEHIASINGTVIQPNSITDVNLAPNSVGISEIAQNAVGESELRDRVLTEDKLALSPSPNQVITTDENNIPRWENVSNLTTEVSLEIAENAMDIAVHINEDEDTVIGNEVTNGTDGTLVLGGSGTNASPYTLDVATGGIDTPELANNSVNNAKLANNAVRTENILNGTVAPIDIAPSEAAPSNIQILSTNTGGIVEWIDIPTAATEVDGIIGNEITNAADGTLIRSGNGTDLNPYLIDVSTGGIDTDELANNSVNNTKLANNAVRTINILDGTITTDDIAPSAPAPSNAQILSTNTAGNVEWIDLPVGGTGSTEQGDGTTILGDGSDLDRFRVGEIGSGEITNGSLLLEDFNGNGATNGQIIKWDGNSNTWIITDDSTGGTGIPALSNGSILIGDGSNIPQERTLNGDAIINNLGELTIAIDAITAEKINTDVAGNGLNQNATGAIEIIRGTAEDQILKWNATAATWELATDNDTDDTNEIQTITSTDNSVTVTPIGDDFDLSVTTGQNITNADLNLDADRTVDLNGNNLVFLDNSGLPITGNIGIGNLTGAPQSKLDVAGQIQARQGFAASNGTAGQPSLGFYSDSNTGLYRDFADQLGFSSGGIQAMRIDNFRNVGIGPNFNTSTNPISARLHVDGDIRGNNIYSNGVLIPDYVFQKYFLGKSELKTEYSFLTLEEIEKFVKENNHLPGVKSARQVKEEGVWNLSKSNLQNLEKIEELFLHTIEQEKKIKELTSENKELAYKLESLEKDMEAIKRILAIKRTKE